MADAGAGPGLPDGMRRVLAVVADPDEESFGLGGLLALFNERAVPTGVLCFTHGEVSPCTAGPATCTRLDGIPAHRLAGEVARRIDEQWCSTWGVSRVTGIINGPRSPRCPPPVRWVSPCWRGPCRGTWRNG
ncbi:hypothetical protein [Streptomyces canus]|uniref:hypothetical protein n=1 Tax=Streptomyces canus TaxID=58343 RepID=UPI0036E7D080